jgi:hypothetical protein
MLDVHDDDDHWCGDAGVQLGIRLISKQFNILTVPSLMMTLNKEEARKIYTAMILQRSVDCIHRNLLSCLGQSRSIYPYKEIHPSLESSKNRPP